MDRRQSKQSRRPRNKDTPLDSSDEEFVPFTESDFDDDEEEVEREYERYSSFEDLKDNKGRKADEKNNKKKKSRRKRSKKEKNQESPLIWHVLEEEYNRWIDNNISSSSFSRVEDGVEGDAEGDDQTDTMEMVDTMEPSEDVILPLLRFQKEWLSWALQQEDSRYKGGILADEMGMGKTIQAISLVLTARLIRAHFPVDVFGASRSSFVKSTLVICPVVAVIQWAGEIDKYTKEGSVRVLVYHGPKRSSEGLPDFSKYDFVLTTYKVIECEYRKSMAPEKLQCKWCGNMFTSKNLNFHLKYYCGPYAKTTEKQSKQVRKKAKLVDDQKDDNCKGKRMDKKDKRDVRAKKKDKFEERGPETGISRPSSVLHSVKWERIILDEAHSIKSRGSSTARAVFSLDSTYKWALSGTPLQNRVGELYSLVRFLQVHPYSYFFCKDCDCKALDYKIFGCKDCGHTSLRHFIWWNRYIAKPIQNAPGSEKATRALFYLRGMLLKSLVLRRTKKGRAADLALPPRIISLRRDILDTKEQDFYEALYNQSQTQFDSYVAAGTLLNNYAHIFELLIRLRQVRCCWNIAEQLCSVSIEACREDVIIFDDCTRRENCLVPLNSLAVDHPYLVIYAANGEAVTSSDYNTSVEITCCVCHDLVQDSVVSSCKHIFCRGCLDQYFATTSGLLSCPSCSMPLTVDMTTKNPNENRAITSTLCFKRSSILSKINIDEFKPSTKIDALKEEIRNMVEVDGSAKGIVFSQFTSFLDLINYSLQKSGIKCVQLVGSMSMQERERAINRFTDDPEVKIFLMSLRAGGVALNLTVASHVFLMDPWWNPAVESQAQDRIHRIGQYKPIRVVRFVIKDTIEERILKLQDKKERVVEGTIGESAESMAKLTEKDLRFLFNT